jgi:hypothetical protein
MALPHFGIAEEVRVCDGCWGKSKTGGLAKQYVPLVSTMTFQGAS